MDLFAETDNTTKNVVQEILRESLKKNIEIKEGYCTYYVKLLLLNPKWGIAPEKNIDRNLIQNLVNWVINKFSLAECLSLTIIKMQQYFMTKYITKEKLIQRHYDLINSTVEPLLKSIIDSTVENMQSNKSRLLKRMTLFILLVSKMGDAKDYLVYKETFQALKSIMDDVDINEFIKMNKKTRRTDIIYKQKVVMGIRLFNFNSGKQISNIADLPKIIQQTTSIMQDELQKELCYIMDIVNASTTAIESVFDYNVQSKITCYNDLKNFEAVINLPEDTTPEDLERVFNILVLARQHEIYLRKLLMDLKVIQKNIHVLVLYFKEILSKLYSSVKFKIAVMASTVFPLFVNLADIWISMQEETIVFSHLIKVFKNLDSMIKNIDFDIDKINLMIGDNPIMTDAMRLEKTTGIRINNLLSYDCEILDPLDIEDFENLHLEFLGFCIWKFILTNGALIPGNPNMGVLKWRNKYYVFSVPEAAINFAEDPKDMVMNALKIARNKPELISLLQLQNQILKIRNIDRYRPKTTIIIKEHINKEIQTEIHPIKSYINKDYEWNTWKMLKDAIVLADVSKRQTHSTQTISSHFRCNTRAQTTVQKNQIQQTKKNNYTNTVKNQKFEFGLRGYRSNYYHGIDLTFPVNDEIYKCATANINPFKIEKRKCPKWKASQIKTDSKNKRKSSKSSTIDKTTKSSHELSLIGSSLCVCELNLSLITGREFSI